MKKMLCVLMAGGLLVAALTTAWAQSEWAPYQVNPVPDDVNVPVKFLNEDGTLNCCACHWNTNHDGPQFCN